MNAMSLTVRGYVGGYVDGQVLTSTESMSAHVDRCYSESAECWCKYGCVA